MRKFVVPSLTLALLTASAVAAWGQAPAAVAASAPDPARGRQAYAMCATCHGALGEGQAAIDAPALGGQLPSYIERQLKDYRAGLRGAHPDDVPGNRMRMLARSIPDEPLIADLSAYIASLPASRSDRAVLGNSASGGKLYRTHCAACHGSRGEGQPALNAPQVGLPMLWARIACNHEATWILVRLPPAHCDAPNGGALQTLIRKTGCRNIGRR